MTKWTTSTGTSEHSSRKDRGALSAQMESICQLKSIKNRLLLGSGTTLSFSSCPCLFLSFFLGQMNCCCLFHYAIAISFFRSCSSPDRQAVCHGQCPHQDLSWVGFQQCCLPPPPPSPACFAPPPLQFKASKARAQTKLTKPSLSLCNLKEGSGWSAGF